MSTDFPDPQLDAQLRTLREHTAQLTTPHAVESVLLAALARQRPANRPHWTRRFAWPGAGAGLAGLGAVVLAVMLLLGAPSRLPIQPTASADDGLAFIALDSAERIAQEPAPRLVETDIARTALAALGVPLSPENAGDLVRAQFLVGADGHPLALRLLPALSPPDRG